MIVNAPEGSLSAHGSYNFSNENYTFDAHGAGLQLKHFNALQSLTSYLSGSVNFSAAGTGTLSDPRFEAHASIDHLLITNSFSPSGNLVKPGTFVLSAHAANHALTYDAQAQCRFR